MERPNRILNAIMAGAGCSIVARIGAMLVIIGSIGTVSPLLWADTPYDRWFATTFADLNAADQSRLRLTGSITEVQSGTVTPLWAPDAPARQTAQDAIERARPNLGVETVMAVPTPVALTQAFDEDQDIVQLVSETVLRFSAMQGIEYYSPSRRRLRLLFAESFRIASPSAADVRVDDPPAPRRYEPTEFWIVQRDGTFGRNVYRVEFNATAAGFDLTMQNHATLWYGPFPVIAPYAMAITVSARVGPVGMALYGTASASAPDIFGLVERARDSFSSRLIAILGWFVRSVDGLQRNR